MVKVTHAPEGFYTATEAMQKLGVAKATFFHMVRSGKMTRVIEPGRSDGYYLKAEIDDLVSARENFLLKYAHMEPIISQAKEQDIQGMYDLCVRLWGTRGAHHYELRLAQYQKTPHIFQVMKYQNTILGYSVSIPLAQHVVEEIKQTEKSPWEVITGNDPLSPEAKTSLDTIYVEIVVRDDIPNRDKYFQRLTTHMVGLVPRLIPDGTTGKKLIAVSSEPEEHHLYQELGFTPTVISSEGNRYVLEREIDLTI